MHPHDEMEIFTYVIEGQLEHRNSLGNGAIVEPGNLQYMSAGSGITHSEFNPSKTNQTRLYQIWLRPNEQGGEPRYAEKPLASNAKDNELTLLFSGDGRDGSTAIRQDADIYFGNVDAGKTLTIPESEERPHLWIQVIEGEITSIGEELSTGDGLAVEDESSSLKIDAQSDTKLLVFRLS